MAPRTAPAPATPFGDDIEEPTLAETPSPAMGTAENGATPTHNGTTPAKPSAPTPAAEWAVPFEGELLRLPGCGKWAVLRKVPLLAMIAFAGKAPNKIADEVLRYQAISNPTRPSPEQQIAEYRKNARAFVLMAEMAFVSPRLVLDRDADLAAGEIGPFNLTDVDYRWIYFTFLQGSDEELDPFRRPPERLAL